MNKADYIRMHKFIHTNELAGYVSVALKMADVIYAPVKPIKMELEQDPESGDQWIALKVAVNGDGLELLGRHKQYSSRWVQLATSPQRFQIRISLDIL